ncbi:hypothetical protein TanjilG_03635 [Lupinus angustifolius]|uniref:B box-type domain-containing protein n=1 Tax=Lupinus angustifolius TaxID=3871 RepID=A0A1J7GXP6_LUPAN|nr:PREDICTED: zinc finger protein CONSTANS-LIKE 9-like [Lupinus angustifolius]OIW05246.1 hypothetical protein TanjilG_03635 [Lupinus angustifolius]
MEETWLCSLCGKRARIVCESDQAKLCWECDHKVHSANFLVAKHLRILLCRLCQSPTPWKACGPSLTPNSSICHSCSLFRDNIRSDDDEDDDDDDNDIESEDDESYDDVEEEKEGENQVVPLSSPSPSSDADTDISSAATASAGATSGLPLKRFPHNFSVHDSDDEIGCSSSETLFRPLKQLRTGINHRETEHEQWYNHR